MEKLLLGLMDFQRYENNPRLSKIIQEAESDKKIYCLEDEEILSQVAGGVGRDLPRDKDLYNS